jgi:hypothetical protein
MDRYSKTSGYKREEDKGIDPVAGKRGKARAAVKFLCSKENIEAGNE